MNKHNFTTVYVCFYKDAEKEKLMNEMPLSEKERSKSQLPTSDVKQKSISLMKHLIRLGYLCSC